MIGSATGAPTVRRLVTTSNKAKADDVSDALASVFQAWVLSAEWLNNQEVREATAVKIARLRQVLGFPWSLQNLVVFDELYRDLPNMTVSFVENWIESGRR